MSANLGPVVLATTHQNGATATGAGTVSTVEGYGCQTFQVTGTFVGTVVFEANVDGATWVNLPVFDTSGTRQSAGVTAPGVFRANVAGLQQTRARVSAYTSGAISVVSEALQMPLGTV